MNRPVLWPTPNRLVRNEGEFILPGEIKICCAEKFICEAKIFVESAEGYKFSFAGEESAVLKINANGEIAGEEDYSLRVYREGMLLEASSAKGAFRGLQTLLQLLEGARENKIPCLSIDDGPYKKIRGIHCFVPSKKNLEWFRRFADFLAKYKFNTIFLEIGASMRFESHPELNERWETFCEEMRRYPGGPDANIYGDNGMQMLEGNVKNSVHTENGGGSCIEKSEMAELADYCRTRHISIIPEIQSLSHSYWLLGAHPELAERKDERYPDTWCPSDERCYEIYFDCASEIIDAIKPDTVSIGNDELQWIGMCKKCKGKTGHELLAGHINKLHDWYAGKGIRMHMWGDKLLHTLSTSEIETGTHYGAEHIWMNQRTLKNERVRGTYRCADRVPNDILISDWYYRGKTYDGQPTHDYFAARGMEAILGNFSMRPDDGETKNRLRRPNVSGAEVSLWQETSDLGISMLDNLVRYLDAINILWYRGWKTKDGGEYSRAVAGLYPAESDRMNGIPRKINCEQTKINISPYYNAPLFFQKDYRFILNAEKISDEIDFELCEGVADRDTEPSAIYAGGGESVSISVGRKFGAVAFLHSYTEHLGGPPLHACTYSGPEQDVCGRYEIQYEDGAVENVSLEYSRNIYTIGTKNNFGAHRANPVFQECVASEYRIRDETSETIKLTETFNTLYSYEWANPRPDKIIRSITLRHYPDKAGGVMLFALTGLNEKINGGM